MVGLVRSYHGANVTVFTFMSEFDSTWKGRSALEVTILSLMFVAAITGNILVLLVIWRRRILRSTSNVLMANLACTDLLLASGIPFIATTRATTAWIFGNVMCKLVTYLQFIAGTCSILTLVLISVERYLYVGFSQQHRMSRKTAACVLAGAWLVSVAVHVPIAVSQTEMRLELEGVLYVFCSIEWPSGFHRDVYLTSIGVFFFCIPLMAMTVFYCKIFRTVQKSSRRSQVRTSVAGSKVQMRLVKMSVSIVLLFVLMWLPFYVIGLVGVYTGSIGSSNFVITIIIAMSNSCQNPVIYGYFNTRFREEFKALCCSCTFTRRRKQEQNSNQKKWAKQNRKRPKEQEHGQSQELGQTREQGQKQEHGEVQEHGQMQEQTQEQIQT